MNCEKIVVHYLLNKSPLYKSKYLFALLISILTYIYVINNVDYLNDYYQQIIIPLLTFLVVLILIDTICKLMINKEEKDRLKKLCYLWMADPNHQKNPLLKDKYGLMIIDMKAVENYNGKIEGFETIGNCQTCKSIVEKEEKPIDLTRENEDKTKTVFNEKPKPHNDVNQINQILESDDTIIKDKALFTSKPIDLNKNEESCLFGTTCGAICSTKNTEAPCIAPIPGPQWAPQSAESVQNRLVHNNYTKNTCI